MAGVIRNKEDCCWSLHSPSTGRHSSRDRRALLTALSEPKTIQELVATLQQEDTTVVTSLLSLLSSANLLSDADTEEAIPAGGQPSLPYWEFHDLLFHSRSRAGRHDAPCGGTYRFGKATLPAPVVKPKMSAALIKLYRPDIEHLKECDLPFTRVLEDRRSIRGYDDDNPLTLAQLGEFLYRTARLRHIMKPNENRLYKPAIARTQTVERCTS